jgi:hypothetical protein
LIVKTFVQEEAAQAGAALACGAHGGKENGTRRKVEIGGRRDEGAIVPTEFEDRLRGATARPIRVDPVALRSGTSGFPASACPKLGPAKDDRRKPRWNPFKAFCRAIEQCLARKGAKRRFFGGLPNQRVAAYEGNRRVPRPHRDRKIKGADDAYDAERVPRLHHPVARPLACDGAAVKLTRETGREAADVDHFLDLAKTLLQNLAGLNCDEAAQRGFPDAQFFGKKSDEFAPLRRRDCTPNLKRRIRGMDRAINIRLGVQLDLCDRRAIDGRADDKAALVPGGFCNAELPHEVLDIGAAWRERGVMARHGKTRSAYLCHMTFRAFSREVDTGSRGGGAPIEIGPVRFRHF